ncbi:tetratricopeptide repeat protein [Streptomyces pinistramenti]|uniref:tetratricopeptide repeat protein n=1 Tax=Streptomyces pinistramenti TaxID=2884812 RepID=UPI001D082BB0|nr:tetratricopeptide repeat protein [Streptomyces pinistramenti]MCB5907208.1 tetratricopeptide repeat protein [Streptomyces pinistramenti]
MGDGGVRNEISGEVHGPVVQAGVIEGGVRFELPRPEVPVPRQVPAALAQFVDREPVLQAIDSWVADAGGAPRLAVLSGLAGVGKTATARRWAHRKDGGFPGGEFYVDFSELRVQTGGDVSAGVSRCLRALGVEDRYLPHSLGELSAMFRSRTAGERVLMVLDNVTEPAQVRALIPGGPGSVVLATSQGRLGELIQDGARLMPLEPLGAEHGLQLLKDLCGDARIAAAEEAAERIVEWCGGLPVALHVAAARLVTHPRLSVEALAGELADEHRRLDALRVGKDRAVAAVFGMAYDGLPEEDARLYRVLGIYPGRRWDAETAAAAAGTTLGQAQEQLDSLETASLVTAAADGRYDFHDLVRLHAREQAIRVESEQERAAVVRRAVDHLLIRAGQADRAVMAGRMRIGRYVERLGEADEALSFGSRGEALDWMDSWRGELLSAQRAAAAHGWHRPAWELAEALTALYLNRRYLNDWAESGELGAAEAAADGNPAAEARLRALLSRPLMDRDELDRARAELETALARADESGHTLLRASVREFYGRYWDRCEPSRAIATYEEAMTFYREAGDERGIAIGLYFMGCAQAAAGRTEEALGTLQDAYDRFLTIDDRRMGARALAAIGGVQRGLGHTDEALRVLEEAVGMLRERGAVHYEAHAREVLAEIAEEQGDREAWRRHVTRALEIYEAGGGPRAEDLRRRLEASAEPTDEAEQ